MSLRKLKKAYKKADAGRKLTAKEQIMVKNANHKTEKGRKSK